MLFKLQCEGVFLRLFEKAVELAKELTDQKERLEVLAGILTFTDKVIDDNCRE